MKTRFTSIFAKAATMLLLMMFTSISAWAQNEIDDLTYNTEGDYYEIGSAADLTALAIHSNQSDVNGLTFKMTADIDLSEVNWTPIGTNEFPFKGIFKGNGYKITGLRINTNRNLAGLFGVVQDATIDGVVVENASVNAFNYCGILVGYVKANSRFYRCKAAGSVSGSRDVGGFAGILAGNDIDIRECFAIGDATGSNANYANAGGFVGTIANVVATISDCYSLVTVKGTQRVGGFVGYMNSDFSQIERCYSAGVVDGSGSYVGSFVGYPNSNGINDCAALYNGMKAAGTDIAGESQSDPGVAELDAASMKSTAYFPSFHALNPAIWTQTDGVTQPLLAWSVTNGLTVCASTSGNGNGNVEVFCGSFAPGAVVTINAVADNNSFFDGWTGTAAFDDPTKATTTIVLDNHHVVTAPFGKLISIPAELQAVNDDLSGIYALAKDIDLTGIDWTPIGNASTRFTGKFYGRGYKILNMSCTKDPAVQGRGLFGGTRGATLDGITVTGTVSATTYFTGGLVGVAAGTLITNCHANCDVYNGSFYTGGLAGAIANGTVVTGCSAEGTVSAGDNRVGGK